MCTNRIMSCAGILCAVAIAAHAQTQSVSYTYNDNPLLIAPAAADVSTVAQLAVPAGLIIQNVTVSVRIQYPNVRDLVLSLFSPDGTRTVLLSNNCNGLASIDTTFSDGAESRYSEFCPQEAGRGPFRANEPLSNSRGEFSGGYWRLVVTNTNGDNTTGLLLGFGLNITGTPVTQPNLSVLGVVNSASGIADGVIAPGELVTIYGVALGPQDGVSSTSNQIRTSLGGTSVKFNGVPVPILYASYYQLNVQAPYNLTPGTTGRLTVETSAGTSRTVLIDVFSSAAALFTDQSNGRGQVLAVNQDGSVNSASNPAAPGSFVSLYATGLGAVSPSVTDGSPTPSSPLSTLNTALTAVVGGVSAPVVFAGLAPGYVGLYQVNIQIPSGIAPGTRRIFVISRNGYTSQTGVFLEVQ